MNDGQLQTLAQLQAFLDGTVAVDFALSAEERYGFIGRTVRRLGYRGLKRAQKAVVLRFLERTRLVKRGAEHAPLAKRYRGSRTSFLSRYAITDVLVLAHTDSLHGTLYDPATQKLMERTRGSVRGSALRALVRDLSAQRHSRRGSKFCRPQ